MEAVCAFISHATVCAQLIRAVRPSPQIGGRFAFLTYASGEGPGGPVLDARSSSLRGDDLRAPIPWQKLVDSLGGMIWQSIEHVGEPCLRIDVIELCGRDQRVDGSCAPAAFVGASEGPVAAANCDSTHLALSGVVRHAEASVIEEASERIPAFEAVIDGLAGLAVLGDPGALLAQPAFQRNDEWSAALIAHARTLLRRHAVNLALDGEQDIDALDRLDRDRRLVDPRQIEELAPLMSPAGNLDDRPRLAVGLVAPIDPGIGLRLHQSGIACLVLLRALAATIAGNRRTLRPADQAPQIAGRYAHRPIIGRCGSCPWREPARSCRRHGCARLQRHASGLPRPVFAAAPTQ